MSATVLTPLELPSLPLEADVLTPDRVAGRSEREVARLPIQVGNATAELGELFRVQATGAEEIRIAGDVSRVRGIGAGMTRGRIVVEGSVGMHAGARMRGGEMIVAGGAGPWAGAEMAGGLLRIEGDAGDDAGAAYPGSRRGMTGGALLIGGDAGRELGATLRRGLITVRGSTGECAGFNMIAGSIVSFGGLGRGAGAGMKRGTILTFRPLELLPTFRYAGAYRPELLRLLLRNVSRLYGIPIEDRFMSGLYRRYSGDFVELGRGEIWVWTTSG